MSVYNLLWPLRNGLCLLPTWNLVWIWSFAIPYIHRLSSEFFLWIRLNSLHVLYVVCIVTFLNVYVRCVGERLLFWIFGCERRCWIGWFALVEGTAHLYRVVKTVWLPRWCWMIRLIVLMIYTLLSFTFTRDWPLTVDVFARIRLVVWGLVWLLNLLLLKIYHGLLILTFISLGVSMSLFGCQIETTFSLLLRWNEVLIWKMSLVILTCLLVAIVLGIRSI